MKMMLLLGLMAISIIASAKSLKTIKDTKSLCNSAADAFGKGDVKKAFGILEPYWILPKEELKNLTYQTESQLKMVGTRFGASLGHDYIRSEEAGASFVKHTFVGKFEKHAVRYMCIFYKPKDHWVVNSVYWDDNTPALFE